MSDNNLKPFDVCVMSDASVQATIRVKAVDAAAAGEEALRVAQTGKVEFELCQYDRRYYIPGIVEESVVECSEEEAVDPLRQFLYLLNSSHSISVDDHAPTTNIHMAEVTGEPEDEILLVEWEHESVGYSMKLTLAGISQGTFDNGEFICEDHEGEIAHIKFYALTPLTFN